MPSQSPYKQPKTKRYVARLLLGCYAVNLTQDKVIGDINAVRSMISASTLKLLTIAAALETLGRD